MSIGCNLMPNLSLSVDFVNFFSEEKFDFTTNTLSKVLTSDMIEHETRKRIDHLLNSLNYYTNKRIDIHRKQHISFLKNEYSLLLQQVAYQTLFNEMGELKPEILNRFGISILLYQEDQTKYHVDIVNAFIAAISPLEEAIDIPTVTPDTLEINLKIYLEKSLFQTVEDSQDMLKEVENICKQLRLLPLKDKATDNCRNKLLKYLDGIPYEAPFTFELDQNEMHVLMENDQLSTIFNECIDNKLLFPTMSLDLSTDYRLMPSTHSCGPFFTKDSFVTRHKASHSDQMTFSKSNHPIPETFAYESPIPVREIIPLLKKSTEWQAFVNKTSLSQSWSTDQKQYAHRCYESVLDAVKELENKTPSAEELYRFLAAKRRQIVQAANPNEDVSAFGQIRYYKDLHTPIYQNSGSYIDFFERLNAMYNAHINHDNQRIQPGILKPDGEIDYLKTSCHIETESKSESLMLSGFTKNLPTVLMVYGESKYDTTSYLDGDFIHIFHTDPSQFEKIFKCVQDIFDKIIDHQSQDVIKDIGRIAWYLTQAAPCERGSAAIAEMFVATLFKTAGYSLMPYREQETKCPSLDLEAIFEPDIEKFADKFADWYKEIKPDLKAEKIATSHISPGPGHNSKH